LICRAGAFAHSPVRSGQGRFGQHLFGKPPRLSGVYRRHAPMHRQNCFFYRSSFSFVLFNSPAP
jgi:hypothetical protein